LFDSGTHSRTITPGPTSLPTQPPYISSLRIPIILLGTWSMGVGVQTSKLAVNEAVVIVSTHALHADATLHLSIAQIIFTAAHGGLTGALCLSDSSNHFYQGLGPAPDNYERTGRFSRIRFHGDPFLLTAYEAVDRGPGVHRSRHHVCEMGG